MHAATGHGITEALRLKNLRWRQKSDKARQRSEQQRWGNEGGGVREGARLDAIIDRKLPNRPDPRSRDLRLEGTEYLGGWLANRRNV